MFLSAFPPVGHEFAAVGHQLQGAHAREGGRRRERESRDANIDRKASRADFAEFITLRDTERASSEIENVRTLPVRSSDAPITISLSPERWASSLEHCI